MSDRQRLEELRKRKRLTELRAKRDAAQETPTPRTPGAFNDGDSFLERLGDNPVADGLRKRFPSLYGAQEAAAESRIASGARGAAQGASFGFGDELAALPALAPGGESFSDALARVRGENKAAKERHPLTYLGGEVTGAIGTGGSGLARMGAVKGGAVTGAAYGVGAAEGGLKERATGGALGGALGAGAAVGIDKAGRALAPMLKRAVPEGAIPSIADLKAASNAAYKRVDDLGARYSGDQVADLFRGISDDVPTTGLGAIDGSTHPTAALALRRMREVGPQDATLSDLDKLRQLASGASVTNPADQRAAGIIRTNIDEFTSSVPPAQGGQNAADALTGARAAHGRYRRAQQLDDVLEKAKVQASSNRVPDELFSQRKAVKSILTNPKKARGYSAEERAAMQRFVEGSKMEKVARQLGKLGSGNVVGTSIGAGLGGIVGGVPGAVALPLASAGIRKLGENATARSRDAMVRRIRSGNAPQKVDTALSRLASDRELRQALARAGLAASIL